MVLVKFGKKEELKQDMPPVAQALSDDDLMNVTGGTVYWWNDYDDNGKSRRHYWVSTSYGTYETYSKSKAKAVALATGHSTKLEES